MCLLVSLRKTCAFLALINYCAAADVELLDYNQQDTDTRCQSGVLLGVDQSGFRSVVHLDNDVGEDDYVNYEIKEEAETLFKQLLTIDLTHECLPKKVTSKFEYRCQKLSEREFKIIVLLKASRKVSNAAVRAFLSIVDVNSKTIQLPVVYTNDAAGELKINGDTFQNNQECSVNLDSRELHLQFKCNSSAKPCVIEIQVNNYTSRGNDTLKFTRDNKINEEVVATIKYSACRLDGETFNITCKINISLSEVAGNNNEFHSEYYFLLIPGVLILLVTICLLKTKCLSELRKRKNNDQEVPVASTGLLKTIENDKKTYPETEIPKKEPEENVLFVAKN